VLKTVMWPDVWARAVSEGEGRKEGTDSVNLNGPRTGFCSGPRGSRGPFSIFISFSSFSFLFSYFFISFANILQTMSNQFLIFSKIQINNPEQYQSCFLNKISFQTSSMNIARRTCLFT
jgi:hypothetical protein